MTKSYTRYVPSNRQRVSLFSDDTNPEEIENEKILEEFLSTNEVYEAENGESGLNPKGEISKKKRKQLLKKKYYHCSANAKDKPVI